MDSFGLARLVILGSWDQKKRVLANGLGLGLGDTLRRNTDDFAQPHAQVTGTSRNTWHESSRRSAAARLQLQAS